MACRLLRFGKQQVRVGGGAFLQYTIEARELTNEYQQRPSQDGESLRTTVDAIDPDEAIHRYVQSSAAILVSFTQPGHGHESIATVRKEDAMFLVRVYVE